MEQHYKLDKVKELADNDEDFILALAETFLDEVSEDLEKLKKGVAEKAYQEVYLTAHKMKPTVDLFCLGILDVVIKVQDWGKFKQVDVDITKDLDVVVTAVNNALKEIKSDFNL